MGLTDDVYTMAELAEAAGVPTRDVESLRDEGELLVVTPGFIAGTEAVRAGRVLRARASADAMSPPTLFEPTDTTERHPALPAAISGATHALALGLAVLATGLGSSTAAARYDPADFDQTRLVFLSAPGPGGGGGGGGLRQPAPPARAQRQGEFRLSSPVPPPRPEPAEVPEKPDPAEPPLVEEPQVVAPVASQPSDDRDQTGVAQQAPVTISQGPGSGGGAGTGSGTGRGEGDGPGIGPGSGGGIGGGPYRPGSGIEPPRLLREIRADYTEDARRRGITGEVVLEIVVRRDGSVGDLRVLEGLGYGLDQQAIDAVRGWRFAPAKRLGTPVDVLVEVAVEFRLR